MGDSQAALILASWSFEPVPAFGLLFAAIVYWRGWSRVRRLAPERFPEWRLASFIIGLTVVYIALASPLDAFASWLLSVHMVQHLLLTMVAPPLILQGAPFLPMLSGLPRGFARHGLGPFLSEPHLKKIGAFLVHPFFAGPLFMLSNVLWHLPALYELALGSRTIHGFALLVARRSAMALAPGVAPLGSRSLLACGGSAKHSALGIFYLLRPRSLPHLRLGTSNIQPLGDR